MDDRTERVSKTLDSDGATKQSVFKRFLTNFGRFSRTKPSPLPLDSGNHDGIQEEHVAVRTPGISSIIQEELERKGLKPPEFRSGGASNFSGTNERSVPEFLEQLRVQQIDGYLIGVGVSNIFSLLDAYPEGKVPKGIVLINIDPQCVSNGSYIIQNLAKGDLLSEFWGWNFCYERNYGEKRLEQVLNITNPLFQELEKKDPRLYKFILGNRERARQDLLKARKTEDQQYHQCVEREIKDSFDVNDIISRHLTTTEPEFIDYLLRYPDDYEKFVYADGKMPIVTEPIMAKHLATLQKLSQEGNIAFVQQDLFNPEFLEILSRLPGLKDSNNLIYLSNVSDWISRAAEQLWRNAAKEAIDKGLPMPLRSDRQQMFAAYENLKILAPKEPHRNCYVYALEDRNYQLMFQPDVPKFS